MKPRVPTWLWMLIFLLVFSAGVIWLSGSEREVTVDNTEPNSATSTRMNTFVRSFEQHADVHPVHTYRKAGRA